MKEHKYENKNIEKSCIIVVKCHNKTEQMNVENLSTIFYNKKDKNQIEDMLSKCYFIRLNPKIMIQNEMEAEIMKLAIFDERFRINCMFIGNWIFECKYMRGSVK